MMKRSNNAHILHTPPEYTVWSQEEHEARKRSEALEAELGGWTKELQALQRKLEVREERYTAAVIVLILFSHFFQWCPFDTSLHLRRRDTHRIRI